MSDVEEAEVPAAPPRVFGDEDYISMEDFHLVLPVHPRTPYGWDNFDLEPDVEFPTGSVTRKAWKAGRVREWYENRPSSRSWRSRVARAAQTNVVPSERFYEVTDTINFLSSTPEWIEGLAAGTEELIVRIVRPKEGTTP